MNRGLAPAAPRPTIAAIRALAPGIALVILAAALTACSTFAPQRSEPAPEPGPAPAAPPRAADADAMPRAEPKSRKGNPPFYEVRGKRYYVLSSSAGYWERGVASWYGPGFHTELTSNGESYDMYGMTAAHKTLPLPAWVRVTNLENGRSIVVRVNDRGPFVGNRIIDLSRTAAAKLDMLKNGTAMVEVRSLDAAAPASQATPPPKSDLYVQAGAFSDPANAQRMADKLRGGGYGNIFVRDDEIAGRRMYRVRIGPVRTVPEFDRVVAALTRAGIPGAHLALD